MEDRLTAIVLQIEREALFIAVEALIELRICRTVAVVQKERSQRARHVAAVATLNYTAGLPTIKTNVPGLYIYNSAQIINASLSVNETVDHANQAAARVFAFTLLGVPG